MMWRAVMALAVVVVFSGLAPADAQEGQEEIVIIQVDVVARGSEADVVQVAQVAVEPRLVGATCIGTATVENNDSEHPGNDYILSSGGTTAEIPDFERVAGKITTMETWLVLGETITVSIRLGAHGVASLAGDTVVVASICQPPPTTTTTTKPPATTTSTLPPDTTTTTETPVGGVSAGRGRAPHANGAASLALLGVGGLALVGALGLAIGGRRLADR